MAALVSILIPAYNAEEWIQESIESALSQAWTRKEIIIVDDGSTDNTLQITKRYESNFVKVICQENRGASVARNRALACAQGDYIQWLDADDRLAPDKIYQQMRYVGESQNPRILLSSTWGKFYYQHRRARFQPNALWEDLEPVEWICRKFSENVWLGIETWLVSRKLTEMAGPWNEELSVDDDGEYFCRIVAASEGIKFIPGAKSYCRIANTGSLSRDKSDKACTSLFSSVSLCMGYLRSLEESERTREACLALLQSQLINFYPDREKIMKAANELANSLGGKLFPPKMKWKYEVIRKLFGWRIAKQTQYVLRKGRHVVSKNWDRVLCDFTML